MLKKKRAIANAATGHVTRLQSQTLDPAGLAPFDLQDKVRRALSILPEEDQYLLRDKLLTGLKAARVNISSALLLLGIPARAADDLTPSDLGKLLRYVRINMPEAIKALAEPLAELLLRGAEPTLAGQKVSKAA